MARLRRWQLCHAEVPAQDSLCCPWICAHSSLIYCRFWHRRSPCPQQAQPSCSTPAAALAQMDEVLFSRVENSGSPASERFQSLSRVPAMAFSGCWAELCRTKELCALPPAPSPQPPARDITGQGLCGNSGDNGKQFHCDVVLNLGGKRLQWFSALQ